MRKLFGTDGIRGVINKEPMTPSTMVKLGKSIAKYFKNQNNKNQHQIIIGKDTRISGYIIENALTAGICATGVDVLLVGPLPTPAIAQLTKSLNCDAGIVISASHNPAKDNGIKLFDSEGYKLPDKVEEEIEKIYFENNFELVEAEKLGKARRVDDARGRYISYAKDAINSYNLRGIKIVLDCANGAAYYVAPRIFLELGAEVTVLNEEPDGLNINFECGATHPEAIQEKVKELNAHIGIALDGDADRIIVCDEKGKIIDGDRILLILAEHLIKNKQLNKNTLVVTDYSNLGLDAAMIKLKGGTLRVQNGDRYVIEGMKQGNYNLGGEKSGHIILGNCSTTGDGIIAGLQLLKIMKKSDKKISELANNMIEFPQINVGIEVKEKKPFDVMPDVKAKIDEINKALENKGRMILRYSGTENICRIMLESQDENQIKILANELAEKIKKEVGV